MAGEAITTAFSQKPCVDSNPPLIKRKRNLPGTPDPEAEVIALSPKTLMATNRFLCEICGKGFQRDQNLQLHRRGHNLPWKLKQRSNKEPRKRVYVCPEKTCVHHHPSRALGDLTGIKKHFCRKHGEKKWKCEKCSKRYAVQSDWKAHLKTCGTREYRCDCGTLFARRDSFITHRAFCDALAEETARLTAASNINNILDSGNVNFPFIGNSLKPNMAQHLSSIFKPIVDENGEIPQARAHLSLWMGQGPQNNDTMSNNLQELHQVMSMNPSTMYIDPSASCTNPQSTDYQLTWGCGNKDSSSNSGKLTSTPLPAGNIKDVDSPQMVSAPSLYSSQHYNHHPPLANMSATALLQKAAQMGVTLTNPSFRGSLGVKYHSTHLQGGNEYNEERSLNPIISNYKADLESSIDDISLMNHPQSYLMRSSSQKDDQEGQTRDFLGVGVQALCPSSVHGWV
ncbi:hypothetical protein MRB53_026799 [Persea americana]|uniref:Uncharacterized protein n=1 Tax=Persea americana TaxID=3435 RepID=A0ACC2LJZ6_PERAE|nr:hypothetical protein MRB53_026799 [Persea americana]